MDIEEIKIRQLTNQYLITPSDKLTVVRDLCGIQSQFMTNALHSLKIRCNDFDIETVKDGLVKNWTVRGTVHVFAEDDLPLFIHCNNGVNYRKTQWNGYSWERGGGYALTPERQKHLAEVILNALKEKVLTREDLKIVCRENGMNPDEESAMFDQWGGGIRELCECGYMNYVVQEKKAYCLAPEFVPIPEEKAKLEIARRYFTHIAPATIHDAMYYFHESAKQIQAWLSELPITSSECRGKTYYYIENGKDYHKSIPKCIFLAGFDQLMLGYEKKESLYLETENIRQIFNLAGIVMPPLMLDGKVIGKWKRKNKKLTIELFSNVSSSDRDVIRDKSLELWDDITKIEFTGE